MDNCTPGNPPATPTDIIDDARLFTDADIRRACALLDALDGDLNAAIRAVTVASDLRQLVAVREVAE